MDLAAASDNVAEMGYPVVGTVTSMNDSFQECLRGLVEDIFVAKWMTESIPIERSVRLQDLPMNICPWCPGSHTIGHGA